MSRHSSSSETVAADAAASVDQKSRGHGAATPTEKPLSVHEQSGSEYVGKEIARVQSEQQFVTGMPLVLVLASLTIVFFLMMLDNTILATAIPFITDEFHSLLDIGWYAGAFTLAAAALQPLTGKVYQRLSSKWTYLTCFLLFEVGSAICGAATSSSMLIVGRAVAGMGGAGLLNGSMIILSFCVPAQRQPILLGLLMAIGQLGIAFGPLIGGAFTQYATWRWCFYVNLPIGAVIALGIIFIDIPDDPAKPDWRTVLPNAVKEFDLIGFVLFAPASIMIFLALQYGGNQYAWNSSVVIGLFVGSGAMFIVWVVWDIRAGDDAMVPVSMFQKRATWASFLQSVFFPGTVFISAYYLPIFFQAVQGVTPFQSGVRVLPNILAQMIFGMIAGAAIQKVGYYLPFIVVGSVLNVIGTTLSGTLLPDSSSGQWIGYQIIFGAGRGLAMAVPMLAVQYSVTRQQLPAAMSGIFFIQFLGGAVFIALAQTIFTNGLRELIPYYAPGVDAEAVIAAGGSAASVSKGLTPEQVGYVVLAFAKSLGRAAYFAGGLGGAALIASLFMGWINLNVVPKKDGTRSDTEEGAKPAMGMVV